MLVLGHFKDDYMTPGVFLGPPGQSGCTLGVSRSILFVTFYTVRAVRETRLKYTAVLNHSLAIYWLTSNTFFHRLWTRLFFIKPVGPDPLQSTLLLFPCHYNGVTNDDLMWLSIAIMRFLMVLGFGNRLILPLMGLFSSFHAMEIRWKGVTFFLLSPLSSSFISFVARHQRRSPEVSAALRRNIFW